MSGDLPLWAGPAPDLGPCEKCGKKLRGSAAIVDTPERRTYYHPRCRPPTREDLLESVADAARRMLYSKGFGPGHLRAALRRLDAEAAP